MIEVSNLDSNMLQSIDNHFNEKKIHTKRSLPSTQYDGNEF